jgi:hypothetical protein
MVPCLLLPISRHPTAAYCTAALVGSVHNGRSGSRGQLCELDIALDIDMQGCTPPLLQQDCQVERLWCLACKRRKLFTSRVLFFFACQSSHCTMSRSPRGVLVATSAKRPLHLGLVRPVWSATSSTESFPSQRRTYSAVAILCLIHYGNQTDVLWCFGTATATDTTAAVTTATATTATAADTTAPAVWHVIQSSKDAWGSCSHLLQVCNRRH